MNLAQLVNGTIFSKSLESVKEMKEAQEKLAKAYSEAVVEGMDIKSLITMVEEELYRAYTEDYSYKELIEEVQEINPGLLEG